MKWVKNLEKHLKKRFITCALDSIIIVLIAVCLFIFLTSKFNFNFKKELTPSDFVGLIFTLIAIFVVPRSIKVFLENRKGAKSLLQHDCDKLLLLSENYFSAIEDSCKKGEVLSEVFIQELLRLWQRIDIKYDSLVSNMKNEKLKDDDLEDVATKWYEYFNETASDIRNTGYIFTPEKVLVMARKRDLFENAVERLKLHINSN